MDNNDRCINLVRVLCDSRRVQTIAITCRCGNRWTERIPQELHESTMICCFECIRCSTQYLLRDKVLIRVKEDIDDQQQTVNTTIHNNDIRHYDS
jgi:hypothetical protein